MQRSLRATVLAFWLTAPVAAGTIPTILPVQTFSASAPLVEFGSAIDMDGVLAAVISPGELAIHTFTYNFQTASWQVGPTILPTGVEALGSVVAVGGTTIFYLGITKEGAFPGPPQQWELRARSLLPPQEVVLMAAEGASPASLAARADILVAGKPWAGSAAWARIWEREAGVWSQTFFAQEPALFNTYGRAVALHANWAVVGEPSRPPHGAVHVLSRQSGVGWAPVQIIEFPSLQANSVMFGSSVAIDGKCLVVGMPGLDDGRTVAVDVGGFASYQHDPADSWTLSQAVLPEPALAVDRWGSAITLVDGHLVLGGHQVQSSSATPQGDGALFERVGTDCATGSWKEKARLRAPTLVNDPNVDGDYGIDVAGHPSSGILVADPLGPAGQSDGRVYAFARQVLALFADGFESGDLSAWFATVP